ncbi:Uncharacterized protein OS=Sorangium cellulosum (strain So ce56) GN=sce5710 PE=4 SV=1 [Gemmataceae bacterium]|nr:Uncharacterized protein OS=Sorangium cellulosum (strain So ce56) GN=sce5710 PE=4 SV=1 [Gemmataceae bacterium]VTT96388.1 Uncharacterized protein OS=Sorangium cellulosum (strain So ce56) GN=sce5710 PE=4 SV=1 [Gemmataceae bacterium]
MPSPRCPHCEFSYAWDGAFCGHCQKPYPLRGVWDAAVDPEWFAGHHRATNRELVLVGCGSVRTIERFLPPATGPALDALERAALASTTATVRGAARACWELSRVVEYVRTNSATGSPAFLATDALAALAGTATDRNFPIVPHVTHHVALAEAQARVPATPDERHARPGFLDEFRGPAFRHAAMSGREPPDLTPAEREEWDRWQAASAHASATRQKRQEATAAASAALCDVYRDVVEYPFQRVAFDPAWRTSTAVAMAKGFVETGDFSAMPILADALQDAGCDDPEVLGHCRSDRPHYRGCWVVERVLARR